jgi:hypothetical protein
MATQLNPAWRRRAVSSDHLAEVSNRVPSDGRQSGLVAGDCQVIPFLLDNPAQDWIVRGLSRALTRRGQRNHLYHTQGESPQPPLPAHAAPEATAATGHELYLLSTTSAAAVRSGGFDHVVLLVPAGLEAVLTAYQHIKLLSQERRPDIGVVMIGPRDQHAAWRYFRKLAVGALRYLDTPLLNLGFLTQDVVPGPGLDDHHIPDALKQLGERLLRSEFYSHPGSGDARPEATPL